MTDSWIGIGIRNETAEGERGVRQSLSNIEGAAQRAKSATDELSGALRRGLGALGGFLTVREVIRNTIEAEQSVQKLRAAIRATGGAAGQSVEGLQAYAEQMQRVTTFSDDAVMSAQALMLTFNKVSGDTFPRAMSAASDMAAALGQDLGSAAFAVGKALQNPAEGLSMLGRQIGGIDDQTEKYIKRLVETGHLQQAQAKVLELLESRYKGNAEAMRNTLGGAITGLKNAFGDLLEGKGGSVNELTGSINSLTKTLTDPDTINAFQQFVSGVLKAVELLVGAGRTTVEVMRSIGEEAAKFMLMFSDPAAIMRMEQIARMGGERLDKSKDFKTPEGKAAVNAALAKANPEWANQKWERGEGLSLKMVKPKEEPDVLSGEAAKEAERAKAAYDQLRASLFGVVDGVNAYADAMAIAKKAGASPEEIAAISDAYAETLVGGLDEVTVATREYETQMSVLQELLGQWEDSGGTMGISPERFAELSSRAHETWAGITQGAEEAGEAIETNLIDKLDQLQNLLVDLGTEWGKSTATVVNGFGRIVAAQDRITKGKKEIVKLEKENKQGTVAWERATDELKRAQADQSRAAISGWGAVAAGAATYFDEGSKGYEALSKASQVFHYAELAMTIAELVPKGISAILTQGEGDPYTAFARMAAMAAIVAALGVAVGGGGGGGRPPPLAGSTGAGAGLGTVFGDPSAQSKSIVESIRELEEVQSAGLEVNLAMLVQLRSIDAGIRGIGFGLARQYILTGNATGFAYPSTFTPAEYGGQDVEDIVRNSQDSVIAFTAMTGLEGAIVALLTENIESMGGIDWREYDVGAWVVEGILGNMGDFAERQNSGLIFDAGQRIGDIIMGGLVNGALFQTIRTGENDIFGGDHDVRIFDVYSGMAEDSRRQLSNAIRGLATTVLAGMELLGGNVAEARRLLENMTLGFDKVSLEGLNAEEIQERVSAVFSALGDRMAEVVAAVFDPKLMEKYQQAGEGAMQTFMRLAAQTAGIMNAFDAMGMSLDHVAVQLRVDIGQQLIQLAGGLEELGTNINNFVENFYSDEEKQAMLGDRLRRNIEALGLQMPTTAAGFRALVEGLDLTTGAGQEAFIVLTTMSEEAAQYYDVMTEAMEAAHDAMLELRQVIDEARFNALLPEAQLQDLLNQFNSAYQGALTSTGTELVGNANTLTELIPTLLDKISEVYATGSQAQELRDFVLSAGDIVANLLEGLAAPLAPSEQPVDTTASDQAAAQAAQLAEQEATNEHLAAQVRLTQEMAARFIEKYDGMIERLSGIHDYLSLERTK